MPHVSYVKNCQELKPGSKNLSATKKKTTNITLKFKESLQLTRKKEFLRLKPLKLSQFIKSNMLVKKTVAEPVLSLESPEQNPKTDSNANFM